MNLSCMKSSLVMQVGPSRERAFMDVQGRKEKARELRSRSSGGEGTSDQGRTLKLGEEVLDESLVFR